MFSAYCPYETADVLLSYGRLRSLANTSRGIELRFACWCGETIEVLTGVQPSRGDDRRPASVRS
jgi:hypothetical protein